MASIVIAGDTSGAVTIAAPATAGTPTLTLPTTSGTLVVTGGAQTIEFAAGSAAAPSITFTGDTNTGIFSPAADTIAFSEGGVESMRIDASGNVGIGNTPAGKLDVGSTSASFTDIVIRSSTTGISELRFADTTINAAYIGYEHTSNFMKFGVNGADRAIITSNGNFGIGTTGTSARLDVRDTSTTSVIVAGFANNSSANNTTKTSTVALRLADTVGDVKDVVYLTAYPDNANAIAGGLAITTRTGDGMANERMRITSGGEILIGRTSTINSRVGITSSSGEASINCGDAVDGSAYGIVQIVRAADQPDNKFHLSFVRNGNQVAGMGFLDNSNTFAIQNQGNNSLAGVTLTNAATSWGTTSDERKKDIIAPVENALTKLADWRSVYYKYKNDEADAPQRVGLIAQDVQATLPEAVSVEEDEIQTLQLRYTETIPLLVKAIQELNAKVEAQAAEIAALKGAN